MPSGEPTRSVKVGGEDWDLQGILAGFQGQQTVNRRSLARQVALKRMGCEKRTTDQILGRDGRLGWGLGDGATWDTRVGTKSSGERDMVM